MVTTTIVYQLAFPADNLYGELGGEWQIFSPYVQEYKEKKFKFKWAWR